MLSTLLELYSRICEGRWPSSMLPVLLTLSATLARPGVVQLVSELFCTGCTSSCCTLYLYCACTVHRLYHTGCFCLRVISLLICLLSSSPLYSFAVVSCGISLSCPRERISARISAYWLKWCSHSSVPIMPTCSLLLKNVIQKFLLYLEQALSWQKC